MEHNAINKISETRKSLAWFAWIWQAEVYKSNCVIVTHSRLVGQKSQRWVRPLLRCWWHFYPSCSPARCSRQIMCCNFVQCFLETIAIGLISELLRICTNSDYHRWHSCWASFRCTAVAASAPQPRWDTDLARRDVTGGFWQARRWHRVARGGGISKSRKWAGFAVQCHLFCSCRVEMRGRCIVIVSQRLPSAQWQCPFNTHDGMEA